MKYWKIKKHTEDLKNTLAKNLNISPLLSQILINRDITDIKTASNFLNGALADLHPWQSILDIEKAGQRVKKAVQNKEKILIYGDYDVDGISACVLLFEVFSKLNADVCYYIPDRAGEGYGLHKNAAALAKKNQAALIVTVDCGITATEEVSLLVKSGIDVIITDHHKQKEAKLPGALAVVCPQRLDSQYPFKELSGTGVAFKLAQAVCGDSEDLNEYLELVALGTIADVVPLLGENRILVKEGLKRLSKTKRKGLKALFKVSGLDNTNICAKDIAFVIGPRLNASGRLGSADFAVKLLMTNDEREAEKIASFLDNSNKQRQKLQTQMVNQAVAKVEKEINFKEDRVVVLEDENWHLGLAGLVASKIAQQYYRPTFIISTKNASHGKGSGRSIKNFHLFDAINKCGHLLINYGGHEGACGISILKEKIKSFTVFINEIAREMLTPQDLIPTIEIDMEIPLCQINADFIREIDRLAPFGCGNPQPLFLSKKLFFKNEPVVFGRKNFKGWVSDNTNVCEAVGFGIAPMLDLIKNREFDIVYQPYLSRWEGIESIRLSLEDAAISTANQRLN